MNSLKDPKIESDHLSVFDEVMPKVVHRQKGRIDIDRDKMKNGLGQLVLTLVRLLHELLERQAIQRIDSGSLGQDDIERLGVTLMRQTEEIERLRIEFGLEEEDLNLDLGPLGRLL
jgi:hypothetical protein